MSGVAAGALVVVVVAVGVFAMTAGPRYTRRPLLSPAEKRFFRVLTAAVGRQAIVVTKVRIADLLTVRARKRHFWKAFHQIAQKHLDFVILDAATLEPLCAVELDDRSHDRSDRQKRDRFVDRAMQNAGLPLHHFPVRHKYDQAEIASVLGPTVSRPVRSRRPAQTEPDRSARA